VDRYPLSGELAGCVGCSPGLRPTGWRRWDSNPRPPACKAGRASLGNELLSRRCWSEAISMSASVGSCRRMLTRKVTQRSRPRCHDLVAINDYAASGESRPSTFGREANLKSAGSPDRRRSRPPRKPWSQRFAGPWLRRTSAGVPHTCHTVPLFFAVSPLVGWFRGVSGRSQAWHTTSRRPGARGT
jgi:hypothetical protein